MMVVWWYISDFFGYIFELLSCVINWLKNIVSLLTSCVGFLGNLISSLPAVFSVSLIALVAISVIYKLIGRGEQS